MSHFALILMTAILVENIVLAKFLGICSFLGVTKKLSTALGMSAAVTFVMIVASGLSWMVQEFLLKRYGLEYLQIVCFILIIASAVQFLEILIKKLVPPLYKSLGIYLPLITTNCSVLGIVLINMQKELGFVDSLVNSLGAGLAFTLALTLFSGIREKIEYSDVPDFFKGLPIALTAAALVSAAFLGFQGLFG